MDKSERLIKTIGALYESIIDESRWTDALRSLSDFAGGCGTYHVRANPRTGIIAHSESVDIDPVVNERYLEYFSAKEVRLPPSLGLPVGQLVVEDMLLDRRTFERSEIYADLLLPFDIPNILMLWVEKTPGLFSAVVVERSYKQGKFSFAERRMFYPVVPHLVRAFRLRNELQRLRDRQRIHMDAINSLPFAIIFLDRTGRVIECTPAAQNLLRAGQGIGYKHGCVRALHADDDRRLQRAIAQTITARANQTLPGDTIVVRRPLSKRPLSIAVIPVLSSQAFTSITPSCMLVIFDPEHSTKPAASTVKKALHLTDAEAVLACVLFTGVSLRDAADQLDLSINTCKTQLKSIYAKTGCRSHVDLAKRLLMTGIAHSF